MECPYCGESKSKVIDSRPDSGGVRRRRRCLACGARFTTYERVQSHSIFVVKKDGRREKFNRGKLSAGIRKACEKRPLPIGVIDKFIDNIEAALYRSGKVEVPSTAIGDLVIHGLEKLDHIAYIRFASVYREFADIDVLKEAVNNLAETEASIAPSNQLPLLSTEVLNSKTGL